MALSSNINTYADVAAVLEAALPSGKATYTLPTPGMATRFTQRAYKYRLLLQKAEKDAKGIRGYQPPTPYDQMRLRKEGCMVFMDFAPAAVGILSLPSGEKIHPEPLIHNPPIPAEAAATFTPRITSSSESLADLAAALREEFGEDEN